VRSAWFDMVGSRPATREASSAAMESHRGENHTRGGVRRGEVKQAGSTKVQ
jgi:hypothetical protein